MDDNLDRAAVLERAYRALEGQDEMRAALAARTEANRNAQLLQEARSSLRQQPSPLPAPRQAPARPTVAGDDWNKWADQRIGAALEPLAEAIGTAVAEERKATKAAINALRAELAKSDAAVTELLMEQERRIATLEARLAEAEKRTAPTTRALVRVA